MTLTSGCSTAHNDNATQERGVVVSGGFQYLPMALKNQPWLRYDRSVRSSLKSLKL